MAAIADVERAVDLDHVLQLLADGTQRSKVLAGGTDLLLQYQDWDNEALTLIDVSGVAELGAIEETDDQLRIGAGVRLSDVMESPIVQARVPVLVDASRDVAGPQIRNLATIGGNVCNASPSADTVPALLVLDAQAEIASRDGSRSVPLADFFTGPGSTVLEMGEVLTALAIPLPEPPVASYTKVSPRRAMDLAVVGVGVAMSRAEDGLDVRIALGAVAPTPLRARRAEDHVASAGYVDEAVAIHAGQLAQDEISPIDDVRGTAHYRHGVVGRVVARDVARAYEKLEAP